MAKKEKKEVKETAPKEKKKDASKDNEYLIVMSSSPIASMNYKTGKIQNEFTPNTFQLMIAAFFTAVIIMVTRMHGYQRPMGQFYWSPGQPGEMSNLTDFFSYYKMTAIMICAILAALVIIYHVFCQTLVIRKSVYYIPMAVYAVFVLLSYATSDNKDFALFGYNDRFEGTVVLLSYMIMLFYIINLITSEKAVKWIIYPVAVTSGILGLLGVSQALDMDFFRTGIGKRLITPTSYWGNLDSLSFTFQNREIYQTVYNINYVSFYLTMLVPLFAMIFICEQNMKKKIVWGSLFTLLFFNMIGAQSSGGIVGLAVMLVVALIVLNKRLWQWKKSVVVVLLLMLLVGAATFSRFAPELFGAVNSVLGKQVLQIPGREKIEEPKQSDQSEGAPQKNEEAPTAQPIRTHIDYIETQQNGVVLKLNGEVLVVMLDNIADPENSGITLGDKDGNNIAFSDKGDGNGYSVDDPRFDMCTIQPATGKNGEYYILVNIDEMQWPFQVLPEGLIYVTQFGKTVELENVSHVGFENNQGFGSGRGYIWSRSIPMLKDALILGQGADTYCIHFPHKDYPGKYNSGTFSGNINIVVDKPHDLYIGMIVGTGGVSFLAFLALAFIYLGQSIKLYFRLDFRDGFLSATGVGIFLGICGFLVSALVNDSTVSVMPMFYGLLGTGIAVNYMIGKKQTYV